MNCDHVFDILTRGPFPSGDATDAPVEQHLAACHDCRQLAEALRPAVELLHESIGAEEGAELPGYRGSLRGLAPAPHPVAVDELLRAQAGGGRRGAGQPTAFGWVAGAIWLRVAATLLLGLGAGFLVHAWLQGGRETAGPQVPVASLPLAMAKSLPTAEGERLLAMLPLPAACRLRSEPHSAVDEGRAAVLSADLARFTTASGFICCKQCHAGDQVALQPNTVRDVISQQCLVCHR